MFAQVSQPLCLLGPYNTYDISVAARSDTFFQYDQTTRSVTLYPGNITNLTWDANPVVVLIGQVFYPDGSPVGVARITNVKEFSATDDAGWFQVEIAGLDKLVFRTADKGECAATLPTLNLEQTLVVLEEPITCLPIQGAP